MSINKVIINEKTYILKTVNRHRRELFVNCILPYYKLEKLSSEQNKQLYDNCLASLWDFLKDEDKKDIGIRNHLKISDDELAKFVNYVCEKITEYSEYVKLNNGREDKPVIESEEKILAFVAEKFGWTFEHMREMDELDLLKAVKEASDISKKENLNKINTEALVGAFSSGSKQAKRKIEELNREAKSEALVEKMKTAKFTKAGEFLTEEQLRNL